MLSQTNKRRHPRYGKGPSVTLINDFISSGKEGIIITGQFCKPTIQKAIKIVGHTDILFIETGGEQFLINKMAFKLRRVTH